MEEKETSENSENIEKLNRFQELLAQGYLLHGSKERREILEPRQATDTDPDRKTGKAYAVYGEKNDIRIPILMALFDKKDPSVHDWGTHYSAYGDGPIHVSGENFTFTPGYVHILPPETFEVEGDDTDFEYISKEPVEPIDVISVDPSIINDLPEVHIDHTETIH